MTHDIEFDYKKLRVRIVEKVGSNREMAKLMGITDSAFSRKMRNKVKFTSEDILKMVSILDIASEEIGEYFYTTKN